MKRITAIIIATVALSACCHCHKLRSQAADLTATEWTLTQLGSTQVDAGDGFTMLMREDKITGKGDCNRFFGTYTDNNGKLSVQNLASTKAYCPRQSLEDSFMDVLNNTDAYLIEGTKLMLLKNGTVLAILRPKE